MNKFGNCKIHPTAIVNPNCELGDNVVIGPFCIIEEGVCIGSGTILYSHIIIKGNTTIGENNKIYSHVTIGEVNQDLKYNGEDTKVVIGNRNSIRENCTIHRGTIQGNGCTTIGDDNLLMINVHIAHDCVIGNRCILANNVTLGGHVQINDFATLGGLVAVHQFCVIGSYVMIGGCSGLSQDLPPFVLAQGTHAKVYGLNIEGLRRRGFSNESREFIKKAYNVIYQVPKLSQEEILNILQSMAVHETAISLFIDFLSKSKRGIAAKHNKQSN